MDDVALNHRPNGPRKYFIFRAIRPVCSVTMIASLTLMPGVSGQKLPVKPIRAGLMYSRTRYGSLSVSSSKNA